MRGAAPALAVALSVALSASTSRAAPASCEAQVRTWAEGCAARRGLSVVPRFCPPDRVVVEVRVPDGEALTVEVQQGAERPFRRVGTLGLSPVGEFTRWDQVHPTRQRALDELAACLAEQGPPAERRALTEAVGAAPSRGGPWRLVLGLAALVATLALVARRGTVFWREAAWPLGVAALAAGLRLALVPFTFYHQNGQGPWWVEQATGHGRLSSYGPGYRELFQPVVGLAPAAPERAVFWAHAALGLVVPAAAVVVARSVGASRLLAGALGMVVALDPLLARAAHGESYYATWFGVQALAAVALAVGGASRRWSVFALGVLAAGFLVAQAARVHPVGWLPSALLPLVVLAQRGTDRARLRRTAVAGAGIGLMVAACSGASMLGVLRGELGAKWTGGEGGASVPWQPVVLMLALGAGAWVLRPPWVARAAVRGAFALGLTVLVLDRTNLVATQVPPWIAEANRRLGLMPMVAGLAALLVGLPWRRWLGPRAPRGVVLAVVALGAAFFATRWPAYRPRATDVLEAEWALEWRERLPPGATVAWVDRSDRRVLALPIYRGAPPGRPRPLTLGPRGSDAGGGPGAVVFYYRSSLCSTEPARDDCERFERAHRLTLIEERTLPAIATMASLPLELPEVHVALFRAEPR